ncbi:MAG TPA: hypothetical protein VFN76_10105 [Candidatus Limnocylindria bacterium]|nr:hypothetical protein [Candidatus Limnocylindria bacterium]
MTDLSNGFENRIFDLLFRPSQAVTRPSAIYVALFTAVTDAEAGTGTEVTGGGYARVEATNAFGAPTDGAGSNTAVITFPVPTANWGTVTHFCVMDAPTGGNAITAIKTLTASRTINNGDAAPSFAIGDLQINFPDAGGAGMTLAAQVQRLRGTNGAGIAHIMVPVAPGVIPTTAALDSVVVTINGVEQAVQLEARGQHPDGSYLVVAGRVAIPSVSAGTPITAEVTLGGTPSVARTTVGGQYAYARNSADPRQAGYPEVILVPTSPTYLAATRLTSPFALQPRASVEALGGKYLKAWNLFEDHSAWWWSTNAGSGPHGTAPAAANPMSWEACNTNNAAFPSFGDLTSAASDFQNWRVASSFVGSSTYPGNAYDLGKIHIEAWLQSGDTTFLMRGLSFIAHYAVEYIAFQSTGVNGFQAFPNGCGTYTMLTGDPAGVDALERIADRFYRSVPNYFNGPPFSGGIRGVGYAADNADANGVERGQDPRESTRILQTALAAHRARSTTTYNGTTRFAIDYVARATQVKDRLLLAPGDGVMHRSDGSWRNARCTDAASPAMALNAFMGAMLCMELATYYEQIDADPAIVTAVQGYWDFAYGTLWGIWDYTFDNVTYFTASVKSIRQTFSNGCAVLNTPHANLGDASPFTLIYTGMGGWLYARTGNATYKTQVEDVFVEGVGTGTTRGTGPTIGETGGGALASRKTFGESWHTLWPFFTFRLGSV